MSLYTLGDARVELPESGAYWIAPDAFVIGRVRLEPDASVWFGSVLRGDNEPITIGERSNVQDLCVLHTDPGAPLVIGRNCTIGHKVMLHGCIVGDNSLVGINSVVLDKARIGRNCLIGANTLITAGKEFPDGSLIMGQPGKVVRPLTEDEIKRLSFSADTYVANWRRFKADMRRDPRS